MKTILILIALWLFIGLAWWCVLAMVRQLGKAWRNE